MILQVITSDFPMIFKKDAETSFHQVVPLSKGISEDDNDGLPGDATNEEILRAES